jgi:hypothetical protein
VKTYLTDLGVDIWYSFLNGYVIPKNVPTNPNDKNLMSYLQVILPFSL